MNGESKKRYAVLVSAQILVACLSWLMGDIFVFLLGIVVCVALYAASLLINWSLLSFIGPIGSIAAIYLIGGSSFAALFFAFYVPIGVLLAFCVRKEFKRAKTVIFSSLGFALATLSGLLVYLMATRGNVSLDTIGDFLRAVGMALKKQLLKEYEYSLLLQAEQMDVSINVSKYVSQFASQLNWFSFGSLALLFNSASYLSTVLTRFVLKGVEQSNLKTFFDSTAWQFVLSKASALAFIVVYLCIAIGGETLTQPQQIAFYSVVIAISGGLVVMAVNKIKLSVKKSGSFFLPIVLIAMAMFFNVSAVVLVLYIIGLVATFTVKNKEEG